MGGEEESFFVANPWKALADHYYAFGRNWNHLDDLSTDLRIERDDMENSDWTTLQVLSEHYPSGRVGKFLSKILKELTDGNKND